MKVLTMDLLKEKLGKSQISIDDINEYLKNNLINLCEQPFAQDLFNKELLYLESKFNVDHETILSLENIFEKHGINEYQLGHDEGYHTCEESFEKEMKLELVNLCLDLVNTPNKTIQNEAKKRLLKLLLSLRESL